ncbi:MAG: alpha/beta hydrolase [Tardiphaga sp.]|nr:alpha/beta hydrolase [Tardiphaga sp.]
MQPKPNSTLLYVIMTQAHFKAAVDDVFADDIRIPAADGFALGATLYLPRGARSHAVLVNSATAVPRKIYSGFARYLAGRGCAVLTYDYRGTGDSRPKSLVGFRATMSDWAALDVAAAVDWMRARYAMPLGYVGHSFGGQALGLIPNNAEVSRALLVAAQAGSWRLMTSPERYRIYALMAFAGVPLTHAFGYAPGRIGLGLDLPKGVFLEWAKWVTSDRYFFDDSRLRALSNFPRYRGALRALSFSDDPWATQAAVEMLCAGFTSIRCDIHVISPAEARAKKIGHFGFFRPEHRDTLWRGAAEWLQRAPD